MKIRILCALVALALAAPLAAATASSSGEAKPAPQPPAMLAASHILIQWKGSARASAAITRTKEEALELAKEVAKKAREEGADFAALAKEYSDGPSGPKGGSLGAFAPNRMVPAFSQAVLDLAVGEVSDPVETQFGYHIILREKPEYWRASHILITWKGSAARTASEIERTKEEALEIAKNIANQARKEGADFAALAVEFSEGPSAPRGGDLGPFGPGRMVKPFEEAVRALDVDGVSDPVETRFGWHVIKRTE